jgi:HPt (histidine-containing phosphotransfer) domain-containing protein
MSHDPGSKPVFNYERALARLGGDGSLFDEIAQLFLEDSPHLIAEARSGLAEGDIKLVERSAHSLQGLSANFEAEGLSRAANIVEQHCRCRDLQSAGACFAAMERELERLQHSLDAFRKSRGSGEEAAF